MSSFQMIDENTVTTKGNFGGVYTVQRKGDKFLVWCINASSMAYNRGFARIRTFASLTEVEAAYKGLRGVSGAFQA